MTEPKKWGVYSAQAVSEGHGSSFWFTPEGDTVEITSTSDDPEGSTCFWPDKIVRGPVTKFSRTGVPRRSDREENVLRQPIQDLIASLLANHTRKE